MTSSKLHDPESSEKLIKRITDNEDLVDILIDVEDYFDSNYLYAYKNWIDGEIVDGPRVKKYWVTITLKYKWHKMPDPVGGTRLLPHGTRIFFKIGHEMIPAPIKSESDYQPGTKKPKMKKVKIWLVEISVPRKFVRNITQNVEDMYNDDVDTDVVDDAAAQGITPESEQGNNISPDQGDEFGVSTAEEPPGGAPQ